MSGKVIGMRGNFFLIEEEERTQATEAAKLAQKIQHLLRDSGWAWRENPLTGERLWWHESFQPMQAMWSDSRVWQEFLRKHPDV